MTTPTVWQRLGAWVVNGGNVDPSVLIDDGYTALYLHALDGLDPRNADEIAHYREVTARRGAKLVLWAACRRQPIEEATKLATLCKTHGADGAIADAEGEFCPAEKGSDGQLGEARFSGMYAAQFASQVPASFPRALSTWGWGPCRPYEWLGYDFNVWRQFGFRWLPQSYWGVGEDCRPSGNAEGARFRVQNGKRVGWFPKSQIHTVIGTAPYELGSRTADEYVADIPGWMRGVSIWTAEQTTPEMRRELAQKLRARGVVMG